MVYWIYGNEQGVRYTAGIINVNDKQIELAAPIRCYKWHMHGWQADDLAQHIRTWVDTAATAAWVFAGRLSSANSSSSSPSVFAPPPASVSAAALIASIAASPDGSWAPWARRLPAFFSLASAAWAMYIWWSRIGVCICARRSQCAHTVHTMTYANVVCTPITHEDTYKRGFYVWQCEKNGQSCLLLQHRLVALLRLENLLVPILAMFVNGGVQFFHQFHETRLPVRSIYIYM